jgi:ADP-dependent phosphofructokinase/glucokinase
MFETKNVKIAKAVHAELVNRADLLGLKKGKLAEAILAAGLRDMSDRKLQEEIKRLAEANTSPGLQRRSWR